VRPSCTADIANGIVELTARGNLRMPWPINITVTGPGNTELYNVWRSMDNDGRCTVKFPIGANAPAGAYVVRVSSPVGYSPAQAKLEIKPGKTVTRIEDAEGQKLRTVSTATLTFAAGAGGNAATRTLSFASSSVEPKVIPDTVRVFDGKAITEFLAGQPSVVVAIGTEEYRPAAERLAQLLNARGVRTRVAAEKEVYTKAEYPRVWNPYIDVFRAQGEEKKPEGEVTTEVKLETLAFGAESAGTLDGRDLGNAWRRTPGTLAIVAGSGYIDYGNPDGEACYEPGCKLYIDDNRRLVVLKGEKVPVKATDEAVAKWSRPWVKVAPYNGAWNLPPQMPEAYRVDSHLVIMGDNRTSELVAAIQSAELPLQMVDAKYPGPGKALISFAWSPFAVEKNVIMIGASDSAGINAGVEKLAELLEQ